MTSIDLLEKVHGIPEDRDYCISFSPAKQKNWMMYCNGNFIGGLFDEELYLVETDVYDITDTCRGAAGSRCCPGRFTNLWYSTTVRANPTCKRCCLNGSLNWKK